MFTWEKLEFLPTQEFLLTQVTLLLSLRSGRSPFGVVLRAAYVFCQRSFCLWAFFAHAIMR